MATIYCFSATGNSLHAANNIAAAINATVAPITRDAVVCDDDVVGIVFPAYYFSAPTIVRNFAKTLKLTNPGAYLFVVMTSGGGAHGAANALRRLLPKQPNYTAELKTADNYVPMYEPKYNNETYEKEQTQLMQIIKDIKTKKQQRGGHYTPLNWAVRLAMPGPGCDKKFSVAHCNGCGLCAQVCPVDNITIAEHQPVFAHSCEHCLACLHACPTSAINYGKSAGRARYRHPNVTITDLINHTGGQPC